MWRVLYGGDDTPGLVSVKDEYLPGYGAEKIELVKRQLEIIIINRSKLLVLSKIEDEYVFDLLLN